MPRVKVDPPALREAPYGLLDVAEVTAASGAHWRTGIEYDTNHCHSAKLWGRWCTAAGTPTVPPAAASLSVAVAGSLAGGTYSLTFTPTVDTGAPRQVRLTLVTDTDQTEQVTTTGGSPVVFNADAAWTGEVVVTDILTGTAARYRLVQADDGSLTEPDSPLVIAVPVTSVPDGCDSITVEFTAAAGTPTGVEVTVAVTGTITDELIVTVAGHRVVLGAGSSGTTITIPTGVGEGTWPISVRDTASSSYVSGWIYLDDSLAGSATLVAATCPSKEIVSPPWQTLFASPWTIYAEVACKAVAFDDAEAAAVSAMDVSGYKAVESAWWDFAFEQARQLATAVSLVAAIAELEHYIATAYNGLGLIHVPDYLAAYLGADDLACGCGEGQSLTTTRGTPIVVGQGYPRQADSTGSGVAVMATGQVRLYHSPVQTVGVFDRRTNDRVAVAEQTWAAADDCLEPAVVYVDPAVTR